MKQKSLQLGAKDQDHLIKSLSSYPQRSIPYARASFVLGDGFITLYNSGKILFQGETALAIAQAYGSHLIYGAGSDEVGTGDYFGPLVVVAALTQEKDADFITSQGITDSKKMTDDKIRQIGPLCQDRFPHVKQVLLPAKYNEIHQTMNMNTIKARLHHHAYKLLKDRLGSLPRLCVVDQFMPERAYYQALESTYGIESLHFETKAESKYSAVAVASVLARYTFLLAFDQMEKDFAMTFHKGAGPLVDKDIQTFVGRYGQKALTQVAKVHFSNTQKALI